MKNYIIIGLLGIATLFFVLWLNSSAKNTRLNGNFTALMQNSTRAYKIGDSLNALSTAVLELKIDELKNLRKTDKEIIDAMGLRLSRVSSVAKITTIGHYTFSSPRDTLPNDTRTWHHQTQWIDFRATEKEDSILVEIQAHDTIVQVLHRIPRFKFLGIWFGTKAVRQEIVSKNPNSKIVAAEFLKIVR